MWAVAVYGWTISREVFEETGWRPRQGLSVDRLGFRGRPFEGFQVTLGVGRWWRRLSFRWLDEPTGERGVA